MNLSQLIRLLLGVSALGLCGWAFYIPWSRRRRLRKYDKIVVGVDPAGPDGHGGYAVVGKKDGVCYVLASGDLNDPLGSPSITGAVRAKGGDINIVTGSTSRNQPGEPLTRDLVRPVGATYSTPTRTKTFFIRAPSRRRVEVMTATYKYHVGRNVRETNTKGDQGYARRSIEWGVEAPLPPTPLSKKDQDRLAQSIEEHGPGRPSRQPTLSTVDSPGPWPARKPLDHLLGHGISGSALREERQTANEGQEDPNASEPTATPA